MDTSQGKNALGKILDSSIREKTGELFVFGCGGHFPGRVFGDFLDFVGSVLCCFLHGVCGLIHRLTSFFHSLVHFFSSPLSRTFSCLFFTRGQAKPQQNCGNDQTAFFVERHCHSPPYSLISWLTVSAASNTKQVFGDRAENPHDSGPGQNVSHCLRSPLWIPRRNHWTRCSALP